MATRARPSLTILRRGAAPPHSCDRLGHRTLVRIRLEALIARRSWHDCSMTDEELPSSEAARAQRRDRDMAAERRALMRPGMAKVFRQVTDAAARPPSPKQRKAQRAKRS